MVIGTLGKALGSYGAYACASSEMVRYLINTARSLIFSTAPPPPAIAGALAALELLQERPHRVQRLRSNARVLRRALAAEGFPVAEAEMHIVPLDRRRGARGDAPLPGRRSSGASSRRRSARRRCRRARSRLRLTAMASHTPRELRDGGADAGHRRPQGRTGARGDARPGGRADPGDRRRSRRRWSGPSGCSAQQLRGGRRRPVRRRARAARAAAARGRRWPVRPPSCSTSSARPRPPARPSRGDTASAAVRGLFVTGTDTGVGKSVLSAALLAAMVAAGERGAGATSRCVTGLEEPPAGRLAARPRAAGGRGGHEPRGGRAAALRTAPSRPTSRRSWRASGSTRPSCWRAPALRSRPTGRRREQR